MKTDIVSTLLFVGFLVVAGRAAWLGRHAQRRQHGVRLFLAYTMLASLAAGVFHRECWPFSRWQIFSYRYQPPVEALQIRAVDSSGQEHDIDRRAWEPLSSLDLHSWLFNYLWYLSPAQRETIGYYLLHLANTARERAVNGQRVGVFDRLFGPLHAPLHVINSPIWSSLEAVPRTAFTGLHVYLDRWDVWERAQAPERVQRTLFYAYYLP